MWIKETKVHTVCGHSKSSTRKCRQAEETSCFDWSPDRTKNTVKFRYGFCRKCLAVFNLDLVTEDMVLNYFGYKNHRNLIDPVPAFDIPKSALFQKHPGQDDSISLRGELITLANAIKIDELDGHMGAADALSYLQNIRTATLLAARCNAISEADSPPLRPQEEPAMTLPGTPLSAPLRKVSHNSFALASLEGRAADQARSGKSFADKLFKEMDRELNATQELVSGPPKPMRFGPNLQSPWSPGVPVAVFNEVAPRELPGGKGKYKVALSNILEDTRISGGSSVTPTSDLYKRRQGPLEEIGRTVQGLMNSNIPGPPRPQVSSPADSACSEIPPSSVGAVSDVNVSLYLPPPIQVLSPTRYQPSQLRTLPQRSPASPAGESSPVAEDRFVHSKTPPLSYPQPTVPFATSGLREMSDTEVEVRFLVSFQGEHADIIPVSACSVDAVWEHQVEVTDPALRKVWSPKKAKEERRVVPPRRWTEKSRLRLAGLEKAITPGCFCAQEELPGKCIPCKIREKKKASDNWI